MSNELYLCKYERNLIEELNLLNIDIKEYNERDILYSNFYDFEFNISELNVSKIPRFDTDNEYDSRTLFDTINISSNKIKKINT